MWSPPGSSTAPVGFGAGGRDGENCGLQRRDDIVAVVVGGAAVWIGGRSWLGWGLIAHGPADGPEPVSRDGYRLF
jgi:hypothetical protein